MKAIRNENGYSADVRLRLQLEDQFVRIAQIGERFLILRDPCQAPPGTRAKVLIEVDGEEVTYPVELTDGIVRGVDFVDYVDLEHRPLPAIR